MANPASWPFPFRARYLRECWRRIALQAGGRPIAIYGAGQHTRLLLSITRDLDPAPAVAAILDDRAERGQEIAGIPVRLPTDLRPADVAAVVVSSDAIEDVLRARAAEWATTAPDPGARPTVETLYDGLPSGPYEQPADRPGDAYAAAWGSVTQLSNDHLPMTPAEEVLRLPRQPARAPGDLPLPPSRLRAGYSINDDEAYLKNGRDNVSAIRSLVEKHGGRTREMTRILDWGCSTGRLIRHWQDEADRGVEVWGCDLCATSINWASENLAPPFRFFTCTGRPGLPLPDASVDLLYACSVLTHIRELWDMWLMELRRIVRPGGFVMATILDESSWARVPTLQWDRLNGRYGRETFEKPLTDDAVCFGQAFDPIVFWSSEGVRARWSSAFEVLEFKPDLTWMQTGVLLRRP